jgi:hypothetical protein
MTKVALILDDNKIVINDGKDQGVCKGDVFRIVSEPIIVTDSDTGQVLGEVYRNRATVVAEELYSHMAICGWKSKAWQFGKVAIGDEAIKIKWDAAGVPWYEDKPPAEPPAPRKQLTDEEWEAMVLANKITDQTFQYHPGGFKQDTLPLLRAAWTKVKAAREAGYI